jgi:cyclin H
MADYRESSQRHLWVFASSQQMNDIRDESNQKARQFLVQNHSSTPEEQRAPVEQWACSVAKRSTKVKSESIKTKQDQDILSCNPDGDDFLSPSEEDTLVSFYIHKLPALIGPLAMIPRLRRESKVVATAARLTRRFFLSNSVMLHDPKRIMVAAAFLALKVEDVTADVR